MQTLVQSATESLAPNPHHTAQIGRTATQPPARPPANLQVCVPVCRVTPNRMVSPPTARQNPAPNINSLPFDQI